MLKMNKEKFLKTEFGGSLEECVIAWGRYLDERNLQNVDKNLEKSLTWCHTGTDCPVSDDDRSLELKPV